MNPKYIERAFLVIFGAVILFACHKLLALHFPTPINQPPHGAGDWPTWLGAIGTIGTLIGTIVLATSQTNRARREALAIARITAAKVFLQQALNHTHTKAAATRLKRAINASQTAPVDAEMLRARMVDAIAFLREVKHLPNEEILPFVVIPGDWAVRIAATQGRVATSIVLLDRPEDYWTAEELLAKVVSAHRSLEHAANEYKEFIDLISHLAARNVDDLRVS